ncbi:RCC1 domain-containing protein [Paenibacillus sp. MBLB4367]|uniref:RCC1 domain-containing protein n=1 Tax=Paenibacillus sp. MBLB4367 TaxID=3384767 RepID=UPI0039082316
MIKSARVTSFVLSVFVLSFCFTLFLPSAHALDYDVATKASFDVLDSSINGGNGVIKPNDEGTSDLAWGEGPILASYISMFKQYGDTAYLNKFIAQADQVLNLRDSVRGKSDYRGLSEPAWPAATRFTSGSTTLLDANGVPTLEVRSSLLFDSSENEVKISSGTNPNTFKLEAYTRVSSIAAGGLHSAAVNSTGRVWNSGNNYYGQLAFGTANQSLPFPADGVIDYYNVLDVAKAVSAGEFHSLALKTNGTVLSWGYNAYGQLGDGSTVNRSSAVKVSGLSNMTQIASGYYHNLALKSDGTVWSWGYNNSGQLGDNSLVNRATPAQIGSLTGVVAIAAGGYHSLALKSDGTVWAWGSNSFGQLGDGTTTDRLTPVQVSVLSSITGLSGGLGHSLAVKNDGTVWSWGLNANGQLGNGTTGSASSPVQVSSLSGVVQVAAGGYHSLALKSDKTVWAWGANDVGQLGDGTTTQRSTRVQVAGLTANSIAAGKQHNLAITYDYRAAAWGKNDYGQLGNNSTINVGFPVTFANMERSDIFDNLTMDPASPNYAVKRVRAGAHCSFDGLTNGISVKDLASSSPLASRNPVNGLKSFVPLRMSFPVHTGLLTYPMATFARVVYDTPALNGNPMYKAAADRYFQAAWDAASTHDYQWVENTANEGWYIYPKGAPMFVDGSENQFNHYLSLGKTYVELSQIPGPHQADALNKATRMANRFKNDLTWDNVKDAYVWTYYPKQSATYTGWDERTSTTINHENNSCWTADHDINKIPYAAIELDFAVLAYDNGIVFDEKDMQRFVHTFTRNVLTYDGSGMPKLNFAVDGSGGIAPPIQEVFATQWMKTAPWDDTIFHMSRKLFSSHSSGVSLAHLAHFNEFARIAATKGTIWTWGNNVYGQLGDGTTTQRSSASALPLQGATQISSGEYHTVELNANGTISAWGYNAYGQLGDGTTVNRSAPIPVNAMTDVISVKAGHYHSLALKSDGTVWSWGFNNSGQLGDGTTANRSNPVQVAGLSNVVAIAAGGYHSLALKSDGTLWAWGSNTAGQLGDNTTVNRLTPVQVTNMSNIAAIDASVGHSMALKKDGTVWTWGYNNSGQLGDGTTINRSMPVQAAGLDKVTAIAAGGYHSVALKTNGTAFAWGANDKGQIGDGTNIGRTSPVQVSNLTDVKTIGAGLYHSAAAKYNGGSLWTWGDNSFGQLGDGTTANRNAPVQTAGVNGIMRVEGGAYSTSAFQFTR